MHYRRSTYFNIVWHTFILVSYIKEHLLYLASSGFVHLDVVHSWRIVVHRWCKESVGVTYRCLELDVILMKRETDAFDNVWSSSPSLIASSIQ